MTKPKLNPKRKFVRVLWTPEEEAYMRQHYADTKTQTMADHLGRSLGKVYAKVEIDYLQATKQNHSPFLEVPPTVHTGNTPAPQLQNNSGIANDDEVKVTRTSWIDVGFNHSKGKAK
jgi:hypothetical protein